MNEDVGRVQQAEPGSRASTEPVCAVSALTGFDPSRGASILPVIHYNDDTQALRNAERAFGAGCEGVMLIEMRGRNHALPHAARSIKARWPSKLVGLNFLNALTAQELPCALVDGMDMTWTDDQLTHSDDNECLEARRVRRILSALPGHLLFSGVAFKYQREERNPLLAARRAVEMGFIPTTSGPATGSPANPAAVERMRLALGAAAPLAIASGVTPENAANFLPLVSHVLVSTGVSASFHEFDSARLRALVAVRDSGSDPEGEKPQALSAKHRRAAL